MPIKTVVHVNTICPCSFLIDTISVDLDESSINKSISFLFLNLYFFLKFISALVQVNKIEQKQVSRSLSGMSEDFSPDRRTIRIEVPDIVSVSACADLTLPPGAGLCIDTIHGPVFMVNTVEYFFKPLF